MRRGFTLIELLVGVGIIGVLLAILMPALSGAQRVARQTKSMVNVRSTATTFQQYANDRGHWPYTEGGDALSESEQERMPPLPQGLFAVEWWPRVTVIAAPHWMMRGLWPGAVVPLDDWPTLYQTWVSPGLPSDLPEVTEFLAIAEEQVGVSHVYSNSFIGKPALWSGSATPDLNLLGPTTEAQVTFPSNKALLWDGDLGWERNAPQMIGGLPDATTAFVFADGHAAMHNPQDAGEAVDNPLNGGESTKLHNTKGGVTGREY